MPFEITSWAAAWFLPFVLPVCAWVIWSDLRAMRIPNTSVMTLAGIYVVIGLIAMPSFWPAYILGLAAIVIVLIFGIIANAAGLMGAGDSKFLAAAAPFIHPGDARILLFIFAANLLACFVTHRVAKYTPLRRMAPDWDSWDKGPKFPMGFALGSTLVMYLIFGILWGQ
jgi:prepilin peptidase CpaA